MTPTHCGHHSTLTGNETPTPHCCPRGGTPSLVCCERTIRCQTAWDALGLVHFMNMGDFISERKVWEGRWSSCSCPEAGEWMWSVCWGSTCLAWRQPGRGANSWGEPLKRKCQNEASYTLPSGWTRDSASGAVPTWPCRPGQAAECSPAKHGLQTSFSQVITTARRS